MPISESPSSQSAYHQKMFKLWMAEQSQNLNSEFVTAPVVFTVAKWVGTTDCSIPVLHGISALLELVTNSPNCLTETQVLEIAKVIENYTIPVSADPTLKSLPKPIIKGKNMGDRQP